MFRAIIFFLLLLPVSCLAQFTISGRVLNQVDAKPVANTSVFLSNATIGSKTAEDGTFTLHNVPPGKYALIVSNVAYEAYSQNILVSDHNIKLETITIFPKTRGLKEVTITVDPNRSRYLSWFKDAFLGKSELAQDCKLLNPEILNLDFDEQTNTLTASAPDFLEIENDALGYKVKYLLKDLTVSDLDQSSQKIKYEGSFFFEPLKGTPSQQKRWEKRRQETYEGSEIHFMRSVLRSRLDRDGFRVLQLAGYRNIARPSDSLINAKIKYYRAQSRKGRDSLSYWFRVSKFPKFFQQLATFPLNKGDVIKPTDQPGIYALGCELDGLYVTYNKDRHFPKPNLSHLMLDDHYQTSNLHYDMSTTHSTLISFNEPNVFIDLNGTITNPYSISLDGVWITKRVADLLPLDYEPPQNEDMQMDSTVSKNVMAKLNSFSGHSTTEKAYLHFDKPYYAAGDTIYFKAYLASGEKHQLSALSGVLHVDLINRDNKIDQSINLEVVDGVAWGDFALPDSLKNGNYRVRAYTNLMRNDGDRAFFDQPVPVGFTPTNKVTESGTRRAGNPDAKPDIQFFPESGELVAGIKSKVAFKAINSSGSGIAVKGAIIDNDNKEVVGLASAHLGMGYFYLTPQEGKTYKAKLIYADGSQSTIDIPVPAARGVALSVDNGSVNASVKIMSSQVYYKENQGKYYTLVTYSGGNAKSTIFKLDNSEIAIDISKQGLSSGVASITLFSPTSEPLCERLFFIQNDDQLNMGISSDKTTYVKKDKVSIKLNTTIKGGEPAQGHFSVAVIDEGRVPVNENAESTILTDLLLTSDLKGYIEQPNYYFTNANDATRRDLDLVMLTHGYRKFDWKQVFDNSAPQITYQPERSLELAGSLKTFAGKPIPNGNIVLLSTKENINKDTTADANGNFRFTDLYLSDAAKIILRAKKENNSEKVSIKIKQPDYPPVANMNSGYADDTTKMSLLAATEMQKQYEQKRSMKNGIILKQVNIKSNTAPTKPVLLHSSNLNGPGEADYVITGDKLKMGCANLLQCLQGLIPGVKYVGAIPLIYSVRTPYSLHGSTPPMAIIVDGVIMSQVDDAGPTKSWQAPVNVLNMLNGADISSIEVLESAMYLSIYGTSVSGGAIIITTRRGGEDPSTLLTAPGLITYRFKGFYKAREFYAPKYDHPAGDAKPDLRTTIFWKPEVITDKNGNASFDYYNADAPGTYRVVVEGIDVDGNIGRQVYRYKVE